MDDSPRMQRPALFIPSHGLSRAHSAVSLMMIKMDNFMLDKPRGLTGTCYAHIHTQQANKQVKSNARRGEAPDSPHATVIFIFAFNSSSCRYSLPSKTPRSPCPPNFIGVRAKWSIDHRCRTCELQSSLLINGMHMVSAALSLSLRRTKGRVRPAANPPKLSRG